MNILIAESDFSKANDLKNIVCEIEPEAVVTASVRRVSETIRFLASGGEADLLLMNTDLADGKSFRIFQPFNRYTPVIFYSASREDGVEAFKYNSIDYLLTPFGSSELSSALTKFKALRGRPKLNPHGSGARGYRERFTVKAGNKMRFKAVQDVSYFFADGKIVCLVARSDARKHIIDYSLEQLEQSLDPARFFRISRRHIISVDNIAEVKGYRSGRLEIVPVQACDHALLVSRQRVRAFKEWLNH